MRISDWSSDVCSSDLGGAARAVGGLTVASFQIAISVQSAASDGLAALGPCAVMLAKAEGMEAHRRAVALRLLEALAGVRRPEACWTCCVMTGAGSPVTARRAARRWTRRSGATPEKDRKRVVWGKSG